MRKYDRVEGIVTNLKEVTPQIFEGLKNSRNISETYRVSIIESQIVICESLIEDMTSFNNLLLELEDLIDINNFGFRFTCEGEEKGWRESHLKFEENEHGYCSFAIFLKGIDIPRSYKRDVFGGVLEILKGRIMEVRMNLLTKKEILFENI